MRIGLLSDTHGFLDASLFTHFAACDEVWHAGDFGPASLMDELRAFKPLRGVWGNIDGPEVRATFGQDAAWECEGLRVFMTHIAGYPGHWERRVKNYLQRERPGLVIGGHSHILKVMRDQQLGAMHFNPGAAGHVGWHLVRTALRFEIRQGKLSDVVAIELGPRGGRKLARNVGADHDEAGRG